MEARLLIAYAMIAFLLVGGTAWGVVTARRRAARRLRMRGVKSYNRGGR